MRLMYQSNLGKLLLLVLQILSIKEIKATGCKGMVFLPYKSDSYLHNHTINTLITPSQSMCRVTCYLSDSCVSYNFHQSTDTCEINDSDEFQHPEDVILKPGYVYVGTKNGCSNRPCPSNSTCRPNFNYPEGFTCLCPLGYNGPSCSEDIDECTSGVHNCSNYSRCENTQGSFRCIPPALGSRERPAKSCLDILINGFSNGSGVYVLDPAKTGSPIKAYCDMTTDGGGWTKVKRLFLESSSSPSPKVYDTYHSIAEYNNNKENIVLSTSAIVDIHRTMGFHQMHFYCYKKSVGRVLSIITKNNTAGHDAVSFFTNQQEPVSVFPTACGSFDRLPEDTSILAQNCSLWGKLKNNAIWVDKWGSWDYRQQFRIDNFPFGIEGDKVMTFAFSRKRLCDDNGSQMDINDTWQISVR